MGGEGEEHEGATSGLSKWSPELLRYANAHIDWEARRHRFYSDTIQQYIETDQQLETSRAAYNTQAQRFNVLLQAVPRRWYAAYLRYEAVPLVGSRP